MREYDENNILFMTVAQEVKIHCDQLHGKYIKVGANCSSDIYEELLEYIYEQVYNGCEYAIFEPYELNDYFINQLLADGFDVEIYDDCIIVSWD